MALSVLDYSEVILQFLGLGVNRRVARFLASHTNSDIGGVASTYRNSKRWNIFHVYKLYAIDLLLFEFGIFQMFQYILFYFRTPFRWMKQLPFNEVDSIQNTCSNALRLWGYNVAEDDEEYKHLKPLQIFTFDNYNPSTTP